MFFWLLLSPYLAKRSAAAAAVNLPDSVYRSSPSRLRWSVMTISGSPIKKPALRILRTYPTRSPPENIIAMAPAGPLATPSASRYRRDSKAETSSVIWKRARSKSTCIASGVAPSSKKGAAFCMASTISSAFTASS